MSMIFIEFGMGLASELVSEKIASKSCKSRLFGLGRGPTGQEGGFAVGTNAKKVASRALRSVFFRRRTSKMEIPV
jgi:hypothetical protein